MNTKAILSHLQEAKEELERTVAEFTSKTDYSEEDFRVVMSHIYHHLNTAWNGRNASREAHRDCSQAEFDAWRKFPNIGELYLE